MHRTVRLAALATLAAGSAVLAGCRNPPPPPPPPPAADPTRDCIAYDTANLRIVDLGTTGWQLTDGRSAMLVLDNRTDADEALTLARGYSQQCFIGRGNTRSDRRDYIVQYWK